MLMFELGRQFLARPAAALAVPFVVCWRGALTRELNHAGKFGGSRALTVWGAGREERLLLLLLANSMDSSWFGPICRHRLFYLNCLIVLAG